MLGFFQNAQQAPQACHLLPEFTNIWTKNCQLVWFNLEEDAYFVCIYRTLLFPLKLFTWHCAGTICSFTVLKNVSALQLYLEARDLVQH